MGSSSIGAIVIGQTGPTGPRGPKGATGATGTGTGLTGPTGMTAIFVAEVSSFDNGTNFVTNYFIQFGITGTKGPTGYTGGLTGQNVGSGLTLYTSVFIHKKPLCRSNRWNYSSYTTRCFLWCVFGFWNNKW
jgi:hypothetical protein